jgi:hypothetical protein
MKRNASMALVLALSAALALTGAVAAKEHPGNGGQGGGSGAASLKVKGNASHPGSVFRVLAVLHAPKDQRPPTIDAVVHFATGDVAVVLTQSGKGAAYHGNVPVPASEPSGVVKIDATAVVNGATVTATGTGKIIAKTDHETTETSTTSTATTTTSTETTCTVTTTETVTTTITSTAIETSTTTETTAPDESEDSESSEADESSETEDSETEDADSCDEELTHAPAIVLTPQSIREIVAYFVALMDRS